MQETKEEKHVHHHHPAAAEAEEAQAETAEMEAKKESAGGKKRKRAASGPGKASSKQQQQQQQQREKEREDEAARAKVAKKRGAPQAFVQKLFQMLNEEPRDVISWSEQGTAFFIHDIHKLADDVLPKYFRHKNIASFQRQLNLYGFRKVFRGPDSGGYAQQHFRRDHPELLGSVERAPQPSANRAASTQRRKLAAQQSGGEPASEQDTTVEEEKSSVS